MLQGGEAHWIYIILDVGKLMLIRSMFAAWISEVYKKKSHPPCPAYFVAFLQYLQKMWMRILREKASWRAHSEIHRSELPFQGDSAWKSTSAASHESRSDQERRKKEWCAYPAPIIVICLFLLALEDIFERTSEGKRYQSLVHSYRTMEHLPRSVNSSGKHHIARFRPLRSLSRSATNLDEASTRRRFVATHSEVKESGLAL